MTSILLEVLPGHLSVFHLQYFCDLVHGGFVPRQIRRRSMPLSGVLKSQRDESADVIGGDLLQFGVGRKRQAQLSLSDLVLHAQPVSA